MIMGKKVLVVDDEPAFVNLVEQVLTRKGYEVLKASNGQESLKVFFSQNPDVVLLDVVMPKMDGWQTCRLIRDVSNIPIIIITGQHEAEVDIVRGLDYGADDYLIKPMGNEELVARVRAVLRRAELPSSLETQGVTYSDDFLNVDVTERKVIVNGERVRLTPTEFRLFSHLLENSGRVLTHKQLLEKAWGWEYTDDLDHLRIYIWHLRHKIEPDPTKPRYIITEPGVGYYFQKSN